MSNIPNATICALFIRKLQRSCKDDSWVEVIRKWHDCPHIPREVSLYVLSYFTKEEWAMLELEVVLATKEDSRVNMRYLLTLSDYKLSDAIGVVLRDYEAGWRVRRPEVNPGASMADSAMQLEHGIQPRASLK